MKRVSWSLILGIPHVQVDNYFLNQLRKKVKARSPLWRLIDMLENILIPATMVCTALVAWFKTDAFVEYSELLKISKVTLVEDFLLKRKEDLLLNFPNYLVINKNCFISRLLSCPLCFGFWLSLSFSMPFEIILAPAIYVFSLIFYYLLNKMIHDRIQ